MYVCILRVYASFFSSYDDLFAMKGRQLAASLSPASDPTFKVKQAFLCVHQCDIS